MRYGLAAICAAVLAGVVAVAVSSDGGAAANGIYSLAVIVALVGAVVGLLLVIAELVRPRA